jgi:hypothetical protein
MALTPDHPTIADLLDHLVVDAETRGVPFDIAQKARRATVKGLSLPPDVPATATVERRVQAYFAAVVRRSAVRRGGPAGTAARFVVAAVVEDLRSAGRDSAGIWSELERGWSERVPGEVLEEFRLRLCG